VFWDGEQRSGRLHDVPRHLAAQWARQHWATIPEPVAAGVASTMPTSQAELLVEDVAMTAPSRASGDLRDTSTDPGVGAPPRDRQPSRVCPAESSPYGIQKIGLSKPVVPHNDSYHPCMEDADELDERTGSVRVCPHCSGPVAGRRKWCSEACRLQAYRRREAS
jgi:hypothetical protein